MQRIRFVYEYDFGDSWTHQAVHTRLGVLSASEPSFIDPAFAPGFFVGSGARDSIP